MLSAKLKIDPAIKRTTATTEINIKSLYGVNSFFWISLLFLFINSYAFKKWLILQRDLFPIHRFIGYKLLNHRFNVNYKVFSSLTFSILYITIIARSSSVKRCRLFIGRRLNYGWLIGDIICQILSFLNIINSVERRVLKSFVFCSPLHYTQNQLFFNTSYYFKEEMKWLIGSEPHNLIGVR